MPSSQIERKLAAIMFTDIAGYTEQMSKDESVAISLLNKKESVLKPLIEEHNGTYVKNMGDGSLSHFNSAVDAATCAKRFQESIYDDKDLNVRVGVHLGDTIFEKGDIRGDGVNIASRLESMAVEGGVFVSKEVHDQLANQKEFEGVSLGLQSMKGVGRLIEVYGLKGDKLNEPSPSQYQDNKVAVHSDDEVPSIAIIPFDNKGKEEDAFYAYGISVDLISDCSNAGLIKVAGIKEVEELGAIPFKERAKKLFVRYVATGSLWKRGKMFQLSIELYDTKDAKVVWSDRWQEKWDNLPTIKFNLSDGLLKSLDTKPKVVQKVETQNAEAYEYYIRAKHIFFKRKSINDIEVARELLYKSLDIDTNLIAAKNTLGNTYSVTSDYEKALGIYKSALKEAENIGDKQCIGIILGSIGNHYSHFNNSLALKYYYRALDIFKQLGIDKEIARTLQNLGSYAFKNSSYETALQCYDKSLEICKNINDFRGMVYNYGGIGAVNQYIGNYDEALDNYKIAMKYIEKTGDNNGYGKCLNNSGIVYYYKGDYHKAAKQLKESIYILNNISNRDYDCYSTTYLYLAYKCIGKDYNERDIIDLIEKEKNDVDWELNFAIYQLLEDISYLEIAYSQIQKIANNLEADPNSHSKPKFLSYPIPTAIVKEWEKVK